MIQLSGLEETIDEQNISPVKVDHLLMKQTYLTSQSLDKHAVVQELLDTI